MLALKRKTSRFQLTVLVFLLPFLMSLIGFIETDVSVAYAADTGPDIGFRVTPIPPANQSEKNAPWFRVNLKSGQSEQFQIQVDNTTGKEITVYCAPTVATTNDLGEIQYDNVTTARDSSLKLNFTQLGPKKVKFIVPAKKSIVVSQSLTIPKTQFNGVLYGSFLFFSEDIDQMHQSKTSSKGVGLINHYRLAVATVVNVNNAESADPNIRIDRVTPVSYRSNPAVRALFHNFEPQVIAGQNMTINARVTYRGSKKVLYKHTLGQMNFAPNSTIDFPISWGSTRMHPGDYTLRAHITTGGAGPSWNLVKNFTITGSEANRFNKGEKGADYNWLIIFLIIAALMLLAIVIAWVYRAGKRNAKINTPTK
ncbi:DUF916 and DUF3324 domain-containing protein [Schleiferilactobacillus harbinensis]|uniref:DUF916 and DUF3324 domain-containing protein n=1 Tax=Schleiferilactobacillus harbinensis TaxID=304207 RepID=UPI00242D55F2|nr:DUF916 and DUF3324 domain-containing protein [Schleiferilactobacillus harbinensis]MCI1851958.1 DUF916 and DUF3324 domain-containing protein [Schleiferilactobacillus harbinensis]